MNRLPPQTIDIPTAESAARIVIDRLRQLGANPYKIGTNPMGTAICREWSQGRLTDAQFDRSIGNLLILNPGLKV